MSTRVTESSTQKGMSKRVNRNTKLIGRGRTIRKVILGLDTQVILQGDIISDTRKV